MVVGTEQEESVGLFAKLDHRSIMWFARKSTNLKVIWSQKRAMPLSIRISS